MAKILLAISSTFTSCACGARARDCALTQMVAFLDGQEHFNHLSQQHEESNQAYATSGQMRKGMFLDPGPLVGSTRGFRTKERVPMSGGMGGMEMDGHEEVSVVRQKPSVKGKERAVLMVRRGGDRRKRRVCVVFFFYSSSCSFILFYFQDHETLRNHQSITPIYPRPTLLPHIRPDLSQERNFFSANGLQILLYQRTTRTTHCRRSWARTGCRPRWASDGFIVKSRR
jgi:hypothetical protein